MAELMFVMTVDAGIPVAMGVIPTASPFVDDMLSVGVPAGELVVADDFHDVSNVAPNWQPENCHPSARPPVTPRPIASPAIAQVEKLHPVAVPND